jgi:hypothetical protein
MPVEDAVVGGFCFQFGGPSVEEARKRMKIMRQDTSFEASTAVMIQAEVIWVVTLCNVVVGRPLLQFHRIAASRSMLEAVVFT